MDPDMTLLDGSTPLYYASQSTTKPEQTKKIVDWLVETANVDPILDFEKTVLLLMQEPNSLSRLNFMFAKNLFSFDSLNDLGDMLQKNPSIVYLNVTGCGFPWLDFSYLVLPYLQNVTDLRLGHNDLEESELQLILDSNDKLTNLDLSGSTYSASFNSQLEKKLEKNREKMKELRNIHLSKILLLAIQSESSWQTFPKEIQEKILSQTFGIGPYYFGKSAAQIQGATHFIFENIVPLKEAWNSHRKFRLVEKLGKLVESKERFEIQFHK